VKATPEEQVRQRWIRRMMGELGYPRELLVIEKGIRELPHLASLDVPQRRLDILCYGKEIHPVHALFPLLLIECKEGPLTKSALNQVIGYNYHVKAHFVAAVNRDEVQLGFFDGARNHPVSGSFLPSFKELMQWVKR
jgi:hypothetical protein